MSAHSLPVLCAATARLAARRRSPAPLERMAPQAACRPRRARVSAAQATGVAWVRRPRHKTAARLDRTAPRAPDCRRPAHLEGA
jgi:hypothetical protein